MHTVVHRWFVVLTLSGAMAFSLIDRFALSLLFEPIKADLGLTDTQLGMLHGIAFGLFYATAGVPLAWVIDRWSRKWVIFWGIGCWSAMTALCGLAKGFGGLLGARIGVGVGEATLAPAGYSLIADLVPRDKRATAVSVFQMGSLVGGGLAFIAGGALLQWTATVDWSAFPLLRGLAPWQLTFIAVACPGLLFMLLVMFIREPRRPTEDISAANLPGLWEVTRSHGALYLCLMLGNACLISISFANMTWVPSILVRQWAWTLPEVGLRFGIMMLVLAPAGVLLGGIIADRWARAGHRDAYPRVLVGAATASLVAIAATSFARDAWSLFLLIAIVQFLVSFNVGIGPATVLELAPARARARLGAIYVFMINAVGLGVAPVLIGLLSDLVFRAPGGILSALRWYSVASAIVAVLLLRNFRKRY